ncbi:MAG: hypothetical protein RMJ33_13830 [Saprospiraceae bacterium]|nr:hypothetical protein [Saprospiraceae bacterium]MDW8230908.1 hypothetical protein [Saprospiraceae bacterium]
MSRAYKVVLAIGLAASLAACTSSRFYTPNTVNLPTMSQKGEGALSGATFFGSNSGWEAQASYSPAQHVGLMVNYFSLNYKGSIAGTSGGFFPFPPPPQTNFEGRMRFGEAGLGLYRHAGKNREYLLSLFGAAGQGHAHNLYIEPDVPLKEATWTFWRYSLQPGVRLQHRRLSFGASFRFSYVQYTTGRIDARIPRLELDRVEMLEAQSPMMFWEVLWTVGYHFRPITVSLNTTGVALGKKSLNDLNLASNHVSLMATLNLHELKKEKQSRGKRKKK